MIIVDLFSVAPQVLPQGGTDEERRRIRKVVEGIVQHVYKTPHVMISLPTVQTADDSCVRPLTMRITHDYNPAMDDQDEIMFLGAKVATMIESAAEENGDLQDMPSLSIKTNVRVILQPTNVLLCHNPGTSGGPGRFSR